MKYIIAPLVLLAVFSCSDSPVAKPKAMLRLEYPEHEYRRVASVCPFSFEANLLAQTVQKENCWLTLHYPRMKADIHLTYYPVEGNLDSLLYDAQKLTYGHTIKASNIIEQPRVDSINHVYGMFYMINGDAATLSQFYATDSTRHFVSGSLYFRARPNYDSIYPAAMYLRQDIRRIMESLEWENKK